MDQGLKDLIAALYDLFKDFLALIGLGEKFEKVEGDVNHILGK